LNNSINEKEAFLIDTETAIKCSNSGTKIYWEAFTSDSENFSLPALTDLWGDELRKEYVHWVYQLSEWKINNKKIRDHFAYENNLSLWWLGKIHEKSFYKSPSIYNIFRLLALTRLLNQLNIESLTIISNNTQLIKTIKKSSFFKNKKIKVIKPGEKLFKGFKFKNYCPHIIRACLLSLKILSDSTIFFFSKKMFKEVLSNMQTEGITIVTYFPNIDLNKANAGEFYSHYWWQVHDLLNKQNKQITWVLIYLEGGQCSFKKALQYRKIFLASGPKNQQYLFIEETLSFLDIYKIFCEYLKVIVKNSRTFFAYKKLPAINGVSVNLLLEEDWKSSFFGTVLLKNLFWVHAFTNYSKKVKKQSLGLYTMENINWERAFTSAWHFAQHGKCIGIAHNVIPFFDLRFFEGEAYWYDKSTVAGPRPDKIAVVSENAKQQLIVFGTPSGDIVQIEAMRYLYLKKLSREPQRILKNKKTLLCATDYRLQSTLGQLKLLNEAMDELDQLNIDLIIKTHPFLPLEKSAIKKLFPKLAFNLTQELLVTLLSKVNSVFTSNLTSVPIEALYLGIPCIIMLDPSFINFSYLRGYQSVKFVHSGKELAKNILAHQFIDNNLDFFMDETLEKWQELLSH